MHGVIFLELRSFVIKKMGLMAWKEILEKSRLEGMQFQGSLSYPDSQMNAIIESIAEETDKSVPEVLEAFGVHSGPFLMRTSLFLVDPKWSLIDLLENVQEIIHKAIAHSLDDSHPPVLRHKRFGPRRIKIYYDSERKLCSFAKGLIKGVAQYYKTPILINELQCMNRGDKECVFEVTEVTGIPKDKLDSER